MVRGQRSADDVKQLFSVVGGAPPKALASGGTQWGLTAIPSVCSALRVMGFL